MRNVLFAILSLIVITLTGCGSSGGGSSSNDNDYPRDLFIKRDTSMPYDSSMAVTDIVERSKNTFQVSFLDGRTLQVHIAKSTPGTEAFVIVQDSNGIDNTVWRSASDVPDRLRFRKAGKEASYFISYAAFMPASNG